MRLAVGHRLGPYEILGVLGAGGMGEVYRARDPRLGREVAIKVLPAELVADEGRRRRFVQEARSASALNHPNIVTIHEIESSDGMDFIVMEYVPGQTLDGLIPRSGMRVREALRLVIPIADALAAAHAKGIVHRDLKPANVVVTREGVVKVLDFGLAKLLADATSDDGATATAAGEPRPLSRPAAITGTAGYMSPEQATAGKVDARSDIFSFGAVLYEMVTGRRAFAGKSVSETLAAVVRDQPKPPRELVAAIPEALERLIVRCLRKEPDRRFQHMVDVRVELQEVKEESDSRTPAPTDPAGPTRPSSRPWFAWAAAGLLIAAVTAVTLWQRRREPPAPTLVQLTSQRRAAFGSFSPDGAQIAFASTGDAGDNWDIWLKIVGEAEARRLTTDRADETSPAWSPDGTQIAFVRQTAATGQGVLARRGVHGAVHLVSPVGGPARRLADLPTWPGLSWSPDSRWLAACKARAGEDPPGGIHLISVANGESRAVTFPIPPAYDMLPAFAPDGRTLAFASCEGPESLPACDVHVLSLDSDLRPQGAARRLTRQRMRSFGVAWTRDGRSIVYSANEDGGLFRVRADGSSPPERMELAAGGSEPAAASSRDRLCFTRNLRDTDIYCLQLGGSSTALVESTFHETHPQYSPDGRRIAFSSQRASGKMEIWLADADGSNPTRLTHGPGRHQGTPGWSPDGRLIVFDSQAEDGHADVWSIGVDGSGLRQVTHGRSNDVVPIWSRDGRFIYFASNRTSRFEIWRVPAAGGTEEQVTRGGGTLPFESFDGRTLYYWRANGALLGRPTAGGEERTILPCAPGWGYAAAPGGVFHMNCRSREALFSQPRELRYWDAATGQDRLIATLEADGINGLSVSPDGRSIIYGRVSEASDLMMIENFR